MPPHCGRRLNSGRLCAPVQFLPHILHQSLSLSKWHINNQASSFYTLSQKSSYFPRLRIVLVLVVSSFRLPYVTPWLIASPAMAKLGTHRDGVVEGYFSSPDICHDLLTSTVEHCVLDPLWIPPKLIILNGHLFFKNLHTTNPSSNSFLMESFLDTTIQPLPRTYRLFLQVGLHGMTKWRRQRRICGRVLISGMLFFWPNMCQFSIQPLYRPLPTYGLLIAMLSSSELVQPRLHTYRPSSRWQGGWWCV